MTSRSRTLSGVALMLLIIPIFAGLLACMPVPIGDPERSRIDPDMTGIWAILENNSGSDAGFYIFEPYDKRTWLITGIGLQQGDLADLNKYDLSTYGGYEKLATSEKVSADNFYSDGVALYKGWLTKLAGEQFFTWEPKGKVDALTDDPEFWMVFHVSKENEKTMVLRMVDGESEPFKDLDKTRRAYERVLKKHAKDPEIYGADDEYQIRLARAEGPVLSFLEDVADFVIEE
ncbi:MAG: hypothetical protein MUO51_01550 [Woeseiaceae bacterium]|nr:hypothetical protein [Woeseiaceae bacterium]